LERWNTNNAKNGQIDVGGVFIVTSERQYRWLATIQHVCNSKNVQYSD
jgi:hypothetical protein